MLILASNGTYDTEEKFSIITFTFKSRDTEWQQHLPALLLAIVSYELGKAAPQLVQENEVLRLLHGMNS